MKTKASAILIALVFGLMTFLPIANAVVPAPDGCYPGFTTAEGCNALKFLTTGLGNTGIGWYSLYVNTTGSFNTGVGAGTLALNNADSNTAFGAAALLFNTTGFSNTAVGAATLLNNTTGVENTAIGGGALSANTEGLDNAATGFGSRFLTIPQAPATRPMVLAHFLTIQPASSILLLARARSRPTPPVAPTSHWVLVLAVTLPRPRTLFASVQPSPVQT